eukprot:TRINITY_DN1157_c0_g2_i1.p1 TRINITY_DN1157_c0_g2~~TRINITY_DN1157_c0_g2_i1.p1  ORF type:complete len:149 (-),score=16.91 TRINITY_DN1157_c0_g2_i1:19-465(-)
MLIWVSSEEFICSSVVLANEVYPYIRASLCEALQTTKGHPLYRVVLNFIDIFEFYIPIVRFAAITEEQYEQIRDLLIDSNKSGAPGHRLFGPERVVTRPAVQRGKAEFGNFSFVMTHRAESGKSESSIVAGNLTSFVMYALSVEPRSV